MVGEPTWATARPGDTLAAIAFRTGLGFREVIRANQGVDPWKLHAGQRIALPTRLLLPHVPREGIVINVPEMRLYYFPRDDARVFVYPVAVGRVDWKTPLGATMVTSKVADPTWHPTPSIIAEHAALGDPLPAEVPPGEDNPLGKFAMRLGWPEILIHGTDKPMGGIGMPVTHGCVRLYPQDIQALFEQVPVGTRVNFVEQPYKLGRDAGHWYVEARPALTENPHAVVSTPEVEAALTTLKSRVDADHIVGLDWGVIGAVLRRGDGLPAAVEPRLAAASMQPAISRPHEAPLAGAEKKPRLLALGLLVALALGARLFRRRLGFHRGNIGGGGLGGRRADR